MSVNIYRKQNSSSLFKLFFCCFFSLYFTTIVASHLSWKSSDNLADERGSIFKPEAFLRFQWWEEMKMEKNVGE